MPRFAPAGLPLHVTQRGNFRQDVFFTDADRYLYLSLLDRHSAERDVKVIAFTLMTNHVHLILEPATDTGLSIMMQSLQCEYARIVNLRHDQRGQLWQTRFDSCIMDEHHLGIALAYVEMNPVRAGMTKSAIDYEWSSARAHAGLSHPPTFLDMASFTSRFITTDWQNFLKQKEIDDQQNRVELAAIRRATRLNEPFAAPGFTKSLEEANHLRLLRRPPGRPARPKMQIAV